MQMRLQQGPMLNWYAGLVREIVNDNRGSITEPPHGSAAWRLSPLRKVNDLLPRRRVSQCQHGARHRETGLPVRQDTSLASNLRLTTVIKQCRGGHQHTPLQGRDPATGLNHTTLAAVFPKPMARRLSNEIKQFSEQYAVDHGLKLAGLNTTTATTTAAVTIANDACRLCGINENSTTISPCSTCLLDACSKCMIQGQCINCFECIELSGNASEILCKWIGFRGVSFANNHK